MGFFRKLKRGIKKLGRFASKAAPLLGAIPGVGTLAGGLVGAGGALIGGEGLGTALRRGAMGAVGGLAGGALRGSLGRAGLGALRGGGGGGGLGRVLSSGLDLIRRNPLQAAQYGLAGLGAIQGARSAGRATQLRNEGLARLGDDTSPDLGAEFADPNDPYRTPTRRNRAQAAALGALRRGY